MSSQCPHLGEEAAHEGPQAWAGLLTRNPGRLPGKGGIGGVRGDLSQCREAHLNNSNDINMIIVAGDIYRVFATC